MVWKLMDEGEDVVVLDRLSNGFAWAVPPNIELVIGDIGDAALVEDTIHRRHVEAILHFAGSASVAESMSDPLGYYFNNTAKSRALIEMAVRLGIRHFVFSSTAAVYGSSMHGPVTESASLQPESPYGMSKLMTEWMLKDTAAAHDFSYAALRYFNVAGADPRMRTGQSSRNATHLIKVAVEAATGQRPWIEIFGVDYPTIDGTCIRDYIHVWDLIDAHYLALQRMRRGEAILIANCGYGQGFSVKDVIEIVRKTSGVDFPVRIRERRAGDAASIVADPTSAKQLLGWRPQFDDLETIVAHALKWEQQKRFRQQT
jgi:UDP-glucose 4-epimerase